jgi:hypothetical protein
VFRGRRVIRVPARLYSRPLGLVIHILMVCLSVILFFIRDSAWLWARVIATFLVGFLFAFGWGVSFRYRTLVVDKRNRVDLNYMLFHLFIEYLFIFGIISFPFFHIDSLWCILGALIFHILDIINHDNRTKF